MARTYSQIARDIKNSWTNINPYAKHYLNALLQIDSSDPQAKYFLDSAQDIADYFLCNATGFRGPKARELKQELKSLKLNR